MSRSSILINILIEVVLGSSETHHSRTAAVCLKICGRSRLILGNPFEMERSSKVEVHHQVYRDKHQQSKLIIRPRRLRAKTEGAKGPVYEAAA